MSLISQNITHFLACIIVIFGDILYGNIDENLFFLTNPFNLGCCMYNHTLSYCITPQKTICYFLGKRRKLEQKEKEKI